MKTAINSKMILVVTVLVAAIASPAVAFEVPTENNNMIYCAKLGKYVKAGKKVDNSKYGKEAAPGTAGIAF